MYEFAPLSRELWVCDRSSIFDDDEDVKPTCTYIDATIYPKLTERVINRVAELTNNRVAYSAELKRFGGVEPLASRINEIIEKTAYIDAWRAADRQYRRGYKVDRITVTIDLDWILEGSIRTEVLEFDESTQ